MHSLISNEQHGYRPEHSCTTAVLRYTEKIRMSIISKNIGLVCFVDLQKAFDTVNHDILLKLEHYGIRGNLSCWFKSFLMERKQYVATILGSSDFRNIHCSAPQRSVLGPFFFFSCINDLPSNCSNSNVCFFADDTTVFFSSRTSSDVQKCLDDSNSLKEWFEENKFSVNENKCDLVKFGRYHEENNSRFGYLLKCQDSGKYLGVFIDK